MADTAYPFLEVLRPPDDLCCGVVMLPFSLGHLMLLEDIQSPFVTFDSKKDVSVDDGYRHLIVFLIICSQTWEENDTFLRIPSVFKRTLKAYERHLIKVLHTRCITSSIFEHVASWINNENWQSFWFKFCKANPKWNIYAEIRWIKDYVQRYNKVPIFTELSDSPRPSGIDWKQQVFTLVQNEYHLTDTQILNTSVTKLMYQWASYAEKTGKIQVSDIHEVEMLKQSGKAV